jgi:hypothetical protein
MDMTQFVVAMMLPTTAIVTKSLMTIGCIIVLAGGQRVTARYLAITISLQLILHLNLAQLDLICSCYANHPSKGDGSRFISRIMAAKRVVESCQEYERMPLS